MKKRNGWVVVENYNFTFRVYGPFWVKKEAEAFQAALYYSQGSKGKLIELETHENQVKMMDSISKEDSVLNAIIKEGKKP